MRGELSTIAISPKTSSGPKSGDHPARCSQFDLVRDDAVHLVPFVALFEDDSTGGDVRRLLRVSEQANHSHERLLGPECDSTSRGIRTQALANVCSTASSTSVGRESALASGHVPPRSHRPIRARRDREQVVSSVGEESRDSTFPGVQTRPVDRWWRSGAIGRVVTRSGKATTRVVIGDRQAKSARFVPRYKLAV
jgi:hypothetical protein